MSSARHAILNRLRQAQARPLPVNDPDYPIWNQSGQAEMLARLTELLEQNHAEVRRLPRAELVATLKTHVEQAGLQRVATGTGGDFFGEISQALAGAEQLLFDRPLEAWKDELFNR
ncbi:LutC/YkgG family protein, partial [Zobellella sp. An-6]